MRAGGAMSIEVVLGGVAFFLFIATVFVYLNKDNTEAKAFADAHKAVLSKLETVEKKLDDLKEENKKLGFQIEAAHEQADSAKSRAEAADLLANKTAIDLAKHPLRSIASQSGPLKVDPIKFEPIRIVIYDKRDLKKATETVNPQQAKIKPVTQ